MKLTIDGRAFEAAAGETILAAATRAGIRLPTLCHDDQLTHFTSCFICVVEVEGSGRLVPACSTVVTDGLAVLTRSPKVVASRITCLQLLLSEHYGDCEPPCNLTCPTGINIRGYLAAIKDGEFARAIAIIRERNPFPSVCGYVCPHPCEDKCRRVIVDEPVAINACKRFVSDRERAGDLPRPSFPAVPATGKRVAVVGGGPGGLTAAYYLARAGHQVTVYEQMPKAGGMLRYGIPEYRLPETIIDYEIDVLKETGFVIKTGTTLGKDLAFEELRRTNDAVLLAHGAWRHNPMRVPGEDLPGVFSGIGFLRQVREATLPREAIAGQRVVVVGGGNTAVDAARTALRLGAAAVTISYRRSRKEMPCHELEIQQAEAEGIELVLLTGPKQVVEANGRAAGLQVIRMALGEPDASGRRRPVEVPGSEFVIPAEVVISAIGQQIELGGVTGPDTDRLKAKSWIEAKSDSGLTAVPGVFACGDAVSGPATVIEAIGGGRRAAAAIDAWLRGAVWPGEWSFNSSKGENAQVDRAEYKPLEKVARAAMPEAEPAARVRHFAVIDRTLEPAAAQTEAARCLACGCVAAEDCALRDRATEYQVNRNPWTGGLRLFPLDATHRRIVRDRNKCIKCGRCIRACDELEHLTIFGFVKRGFEVTVEPDFGRSLNQTKCDDCGKCVATCPTGALSFKPGLETEIR